MRKWMLLALAALIVASPVFGAAGLIAKKSSYPVTETIDRLEKAAKERDLVVVARVDHAAAARKVGLTLRPTELLIFGNPRGGTPLMQSQQAIGIDLPLKALAWEDERGQVWLAYNDPAYLAERHGVKDRPEVVRAMGSALEALTRRGDPLTPAPTRVPPGACGARSAWSKRGRCEAQSKASRSLQVWSLNRHLVARS